MKKEFPDLTGQIFGKITVLDGKLPKRKVLIQCQCGTTKVVSRYDVFNGKIKSCGSKKCMGKSEDLLGQKFGLLTVIQEAIEYKNISGNCTQWECKCDCGTTLVVPSNQLKSGRTKSCGCAKSTWISEKNSIAFKQRIECELFNNYKSSSKRRKIVFLLTKSEFISFLYNKCFYCGSMNSNTRTRIKNNKTETHKYNGIDRLDSNQGYTVDNCVTCCKICNRAKSDLSLQDFLDWIKNIKDELSYR